MKKLFLLILCFLSCKSNIYAIGRNSTSSGRQSSHHHSSHPTTSNSDEHQSHYNSYNPSSTTTSEKKITRQDVSATPTQDPSNCCIIS